jgi:propanol-preferring alcohol dehydrogenase
MTMKAMVLEHPASIDTLPLRWSDVPVPEPGPGEVRIRILACAVCRTDLHVVEGDLPPQKRRVIPGHQAVGRVEKRGPGATRFREGDRIGIAWLRSTCGICQYCRSGAENLCRDSRFTGYHEDGGYAQYAVVREDYAYALPPSLDAVSATPLLCAGIIGYRALRRADLTPGRRLGMYGFGSSAHIAIQIALHFGCSVFVMTRDENHRELARKLGARWVGGATDKPPQPLESAVLFAPAGNLVPVALDALDRGGTLSIAGIHLSDVPGLSYEHHLFYEKNLRSVTANTRADGEELLRLAAAIPIRAETTRFPLEEANVALRRLKHDGIQGTGVLEVEPDEGRPGRV